MKTIFVTGTDTGVGKTLLAGLLLAHLQRTGCQALAIKPFCSGGRGDVTLLRALQDRELNLAEINPFYFPEPVAPLVAARKHRRSISQEEVLAHIHSIGQRCEVLLIEGAGGLLAPLGENYTALNLITALNCDVLVVSRNRLGTINHTLLTIHALQNAMPPIPAAPRQSGRTSRLTPHASRFPPHSALRTPHSPLLKVVFMNTYAADPSCASNVAILTELLAPVPLVPIPFLGLRCRSGAAIRASAARLARPLARLDR